MAEPAACDVLPYARQARELAACHEYEEALAICSLFPRDQVSAW